MNCFLLVFDVKFEFFFKICNQFLGVLVVWFELDSVLAIQKTDVSEEIPLDGLLNNLVIFAVVRFGDTVLSHQLLV